MTDLYKRIGLSLPVLAALASPGYLYADFTPIPLTPQSFSYDIVVEKEASGPIGRSTTATMDAGTGNDGYTWYEQGQNTSAPTTGLPAAGTIITSVADSKYRFQFAPSYVNANNAFMLNTGTLSSNNIAVLTSPAPYAALSFLTSGGNGGVSFLCVTHFQDGTAQTNTVQSADWFNVSPYAFAARGRINPQSYGYHVVGQENPRLLSRDITLANTTSPVTSLEIKCVAGGGTTCIMAISGAATSGGAFDPIGLTGYNADIVVEAGAPLPGNVQAATTATMDGGTNNTGTTWYESGYDPRSSSGLPAAGSTITSVDKPDHHYQMPATYTGNNAAFVDSNSPTANLVLATPAKYSALSFLSATANGAVTNSCIMQYADGTAETNVFVSRDWFNYTPYAFTARGRVNVQNKAVEFVGSSNPRLYEAEFALGNTASELTNVVLTWLDGRDVSRVVVLAVSGTAGAVPPILAEQPASLTTYEGSNVVFSVTVSGGTAPFSYQWQRGTNGVFTALADGGKFSGVTTPQLTISDVTVNEAADYRVVVSNAGGSPNSGAATLEVISALPNIVGPGDTVAGFGGSWPDAEAPANTIDHTTTKYLNRGLNLGSGTFTGPVGLVVTPALGRTVVSGLRFYTANDVSDRDPADYTLEGSNDGGSHFTVISSGSLALPEGRNASSLALNPLTQNLQQVLFANTLPYTTYRLTCAKIKNAGVSLMQIGEVEFLGVEAPTSAPVFTAQPASLTVTDQSAAAFTAYATGDPAPAYQWYKGTNDVYVALTDGGNISGAQSTSLSLSPASFSDLADYCVVASNTSGSSTSAVARLTVISTGLDITTAADGIQTYGGASSGNPFSDTLANYSNSGHGVNAAVGFAPFVGSAGFIVAPAAGSSVLNGIRVYAGTANVERDPTSVKVEGSTDGLTYAPLVEASLSLPTTRNVAGAAIDPLLQVMQEVRFTNTSVYTIYRVTFANARDNSLANSVQVGQVELLGVTGTPTLAITPAFINQVANSGMAAQFDSTVTPDATSYQWKKRVGTAYVDVPGATGSSLVLNNPGFSDAGSYILVAENAAGSSASRPVLLNILSADLSDITAPGDTIVPYNAALASPAAEGVEHAIDNVTAKYLNHGTDNDQLPPFVGPVGFVVTPAAGSSVVTALRVYTANDFTVRDPSEFKLEGANGGAFSTIATGSLELPNAFNAAGLAIDPLTLANQEVRFSNAAAYSSYRLSFTHVKDDGAADCVQLAEVELLGRLVPVGPTLTVTLGTDGKLVISSPVSGTLQSTTALAGANTVWTDEGTLTGSVTITPNPAQPGKFYRLLVP